MVLQTMYRVNLKPAQVLVCLYFFRVLSFIKIHYNTLKVSAEDDEVGLECITAVEPVGCSAV